MQKSGLYSLTVTDSVGCQDSALVLIGDPDSIRIYLGSIMVTCPGDEDGEAFVDSIQKGSAPFKKGSASFEKGSVTLLFMDSFQKGSAPFPKGIHD